VITDHQSFAAEKQSSVKRRKAKLYFPSGIQNRVFPSHTEGCDKSSTDFRKASRPGSLWAMIPRQALGPWVFGPPLPDPRIPLDLSNAFSHDATPPPPGLTRSLARVSRCNLAIAAGQYVIEFVGRPEGSPKNDRTRPDRLGGSTSFLC